MPETRHATLFMGVTCWNSISRALELSFIDLAAAVNTRNLEGMSTFDVQAMVRGYHVYQHVWDASIHEELPCAREARQSPRSFREGTSWASAPWGSGNLDPGYCPSTLLKYWNIAILPSTIENYYARVKNFVEIISRMTLNSRNSRKFRPAKFLRYTV